MRSVPKPKLNKVMMPLFEKFAYNAKSIAEGGIKFYKIFITCAAFSNALLADVDTDLARFSAVDVRRNNFANGSLAKLFLLIRSDHCNLHIP